MYINTPEEIHGKRLSEGEDSIDLKKIFIRLADKWYWFLLSILLCLLAAYLYVRFTPPMYKISARIFVNDQDKSGLGKQGGAGLMDLGTLMGTQNSVDNEAEFLKTRSLMDSVVRQLKLNIVYGQKSIGSREIYQAPFTLNLVKAVDTIRETRLDLKKIRENKIRVRSGDFDKELNWNETFVIEGLGTVQIVPEAGLIMTEADYFVKVSSIDEKVAGLIEELTVDVSNDQVTIVDLNLNYPLQNKGEQVLATLINKYRESNLQDKNAVADSTYVFIKERLNVIATELGDVETEVEQFKQKNRLADMSEQGKLLVQSTGDYTAELARAETQVSVLNDLENYLKDESKNKRVFPSSLLPQDMVFSGLMTQYNALLAERDKTLLSVTEATPFVQNLDSQIAGLRKGILANIQSTKNTFVVTSRNLRNQLNKAQSQIGGVPQIEKNYLQLARNQQIKQELYIFLMQKAEETAISKNSNISIAKIIDAPKADARPVSPRKGVIYLLGFILGLIVPSVLIFGSDLFNTAITTKEDITSQTQVPIVGEISHNLNADNLVVANQGRSAIAEQFRALRANLSFYLKNKDNNVILLTSSMSGEGKSFTAINLANIMAILGKKVLLMEMDLRKPGLSNKLDLKNDVGFSNYIINEDLKSSDIIKPLSLDKNMFIITSGPLPPNPAEILMSERTALLMEELKGQFDYIIMDAPPIGIIIDAQSLVDHAHITLYLVRQKVTQKSQLAIAEQLYRSGKIKNLGIVVNDVVNKDYGFGYGYGNYGQEQELGFFKKISNKFK